MKSILLLSALITFSAAVFAQNGHVTGHAVTLHNRGNAVRFIHPADSLHIWGLAFTSPGNNSPNLLESDMEIVYSADGGINWTTHTIPNTSKADSLRVNNIWPVSATTCYVAFHNNVSNVGGYVLRSTDAGVSWQKVNLPAGAFANGFLNSVYFFDADTGIVIGDPSGGYFEIYRTTNGGQNWSRISNASLPAPIANEYASAGLFTFRQNSVCIPTTAERVIYSTNGGLSWQVTTGVFDMSYWQMNRNGQWMFAYDSNVYDVSETMGVNRYRLNMPAMQGTYRYTNKSITDGQFILTADHTSGPNQVDSQFLYTCVGTPVDTANWKRILALPISSYDSFTLDIVVNRTYFHSVNLGWLATTRVIENSDDQNFSQVIYRYQNCAPATLQFNLPDSICSNEVLQLNGMAQPGGGNYYAYGLSGAITSFRSDDYASVITAQDSVIKLQYLYSNNGCYTEATGMLRVDGCLVAGLEDLPNNAISIYPNPVQQMLHLQGELNSVGNIRVTDVNGKVLLSYSGTVNTIDVSRLGSGMYFVCLEIKGATQIHRFAKL